MINNVTIEICIGNLDDALTACRYPVDRIELNSALELGGLTPSVETLRFLKEKVSQKICCMVRPRGGDFVYSENEFEVMKKDAVLLMENGADGIVFGFLRSDNTVDVSRTREMADLIHSHGRQAVFHKAFDAAADLQAAIADLLECRIDRILTSGGSGYPHIIEGCKIINELHRKYGDRIQLLPGGGVRVDNILDVLRTAGSGQVHMSSKMTAEGGYQMLDEKQLVQLLDKIREYR